ncbi:MAG: hypothetical protein AAGA48_18955 [Myxococcota bacterium]
MPNRRAALVIHRLKPAPGRSEVWPGDGFPKAIPFQYNPESIEQTVQTGPAADDGGESLRLAGPPKTTITLTAELLAWHPSLDSSAEKAAAKHGVGHQIAALESLLFPTYAEMDRERSLAERGLVEVVPGEHLLALLVWAEDRIVPVKVTSLSVTEDRFDDQLRPVHATAQLSLQVLTVADLGFDHPGGRVASRYHRRLERVARDGTLGPLATRAFAPDTLT